MLRGLGWGVGRGCVCFDLTDISTPRRIGLHSRFFGRVHDPPAELCGMGWERHSGNALGEGIVLNTNIIIIQGGFDALSVWEGV